MTTSYVAGAVRARSLVRRRVGAGGARALAASPGLDAAMTALCATPYGHDVTAGQTLAEAEHAVGATVLWHLRVLAGWLPAQGADSLRLLAGGFEIANVEDHLRTLAGEPAAPAYRLGALETAWSRLRDTSSLDELRAVLTSSPWGDPGAPTAWSVHLGMRLSWAERVMYGVPAAAPWAQAAAALMLLRVTILEGRRPPDALARRVVRVVGPALADALTGSPDLRAVSTLLPAATRWALDGVTRPEELWRAEARWWHRVEQDGFALTRQAGFATEPVVGAAAVLAADAWRVRAALETAARGGAGAGTEQGPAPQGALEAFDGVA